MEYVSCCIAIGGDQGHVVVKDMISSAELLVLKSIHGDSAVSGIKITGKYDHSDDEERYRLKRIYGDERVNEVIGAFGAMPQSLEETRIPDTYFDPVWKESLKSAPKKKATAKKEK